VTDPAPTPPSPEAERKRGAEAKPEADTNGEADARPEAPAKVEPSRRAKWLSIARDVGIGFAIVLAIQWWRGRGIATEGLPDVSLTLLDGSSVTLAGARERPLLLQMEASWCGVCRMEDGTIRSLAEEHDVLVIASQSGDADAVRRFAVEHDLDHLRIAVDPQGRLSARLGVSAFPTTIFVDRGGNVSDAEVGYTSWLGMRARLALAAW